jgi:hypothetical protein
VVDFPGLAPNRLTYAQLEGDWNRAGGPPADAALMAAIAEAESGGDASQYNPTDNAGAQTSWGLWQISTGTHAAPAPNWNDPLENAKLAVAKFRDQGLGAWGTYDSGAYRQYLQGAVPPNLNVPGAAAAGGATLAGFSLNPFSDIAQVGSAITGFGTTVRNVAITAPVVLAGAALVIFGIIRASGATKHIGALAPAAAAAI